MKTTIASIVMDILSEQGVETPTEDVIKVARQKGVTKSDYSLRHTISVQRNALRKKPTLHGDLTVDISHSAEETDIPRSADIKDVFDDIIALCDVMHALGGADKVREAVELFAKIGPNLNYYLGTIVKLTDKKKP